jgi:hypothetical protein
MLERKVYLNLLNFVARQKNWRVHGRASDGITTSTTYPIVMTESMVASASTLSEAKVTHKASQQPKAHESTAKRIHACPTSSYGGDDSQDADPSAGVEKSVWQTHDARPHDHVHSQR